MSNFAFLGILVSGGVLFAIDVAGGARPGHALLNVESIVAIAFLALTYLRGKTAGEKLPSEPKVHVILAALLITCVIAVAYFPILTSPFLYDDYLHITDAAL